MMQDILFATKKIISAFLDPIAFFILICLFVIVKFYKREYNKAANIGLLALFFITLLSYQPISNFLSKTLEDSYQKYQNFDDNITYIHVLGSGSNSLNAPKTNILNRVSTLRVLEGIYQYKNRKNVKIIFSGYKGDQEISTALACKKFALLFGVKENDVIIDENAKDTFEEAVFAKKILKDQKALLITSATHLKRAVMIFRNLNVNIQPVPTDFISSKDFDFTSMPNVSNLYRSAISLHEYIGIIWFEIVKYSNKIKNYIYLML